MTRTRRRVAAALLAACVAAAPLGAAGGSVTPPIPGTQPSGSTFGGAYSDGGDFVSPRLLNLEFSVVRERTHADRGHDAVRAHVATAVVPLPPGRRVVVHAGPAAARPGALLLEATIPADARGGEVVVGVVLAERPSAERPAFVVDVE